MSGRPQTSTSAAAQTIYGVIYLYMVPQGGYAPNGNILVHSDSVMGDWQFGYDAMDRLTATAQIAATPASQQFAGISGSWSYDSFGNRTAQTFTNGANSNWATYNSANRITTASTAVAGYVYDNSGNTLYDGNNRYWYDAEGQLCAAQSLAITGLPVIQYVYDAEGARIAKGTLSATPPSYTATCAPPLGVGFTLTTRYLVGLGGDQVTEIDGAGSWRHTNVFSAARLTATYDAKGLHYELADPLGTKRVQADTSGRIEESCVSLPFGDALSCTQNSALSTADDATEHHFTQKERDTETNNDYFFARYYNSALGRFTTPDWSAKTDPVPYAVFTDPQSLNLYAYVRNNPITHVDTDGHQCKAGDWGCNPWTTGSPEDLARRQAQGQTQHTTQIKPFTGDVFAPYHNPESTCLVRAAFAGISDLTGLSMVPNADMKHWTWSSEKMGFVFQEPDRTVPSSRIGSAVGAIEKTAKFTHDTPHAKQLLMESLRNNGLRISSSEFSATAGLIGKWAGRAGKVLAVKSAYDAYQECAR